MTILRNIIVIFLISMSSSFAFDYVLGSGTYGRPEENKPAVGSEFIEQTFGTTIKRLTDISAADSPANVNHFRNDYSKMTSLNCDNTILMCRSGGEYWFFNMSDLSFIRKINIGDTAEPRWSMVDNDKIFYHETFDSKFYTYVVSTGVETEIHDFQDDSELSGVDVNYCRTINEGRQTDDDRYWAFSVETESPKIVNYKMIVYDYQADDISASLTPTTCTDDSLETVNFMNISPSGNYIIAGYDYKSACSNGYQNTTIYDSDFTNPYDIPNMSGAPHADVGYDVNGREVYVYQANSVDDALNMIDLETHEITTLIDFQSPGISGFHVSCLNWDTPGWALITTYNNWIGDQAWMDDQIFMIELTANPRIWRVSDTYNEYDTYPEEAFGHISQDGTRIIWSINFGTTIALGGTVDVYMIELPTTWYTDLTGALVSTAGAGSIITVGAGNVINSTEQMIYFY